MRFATLALVCSSALAASLSAPASAKALKLRGGFDKDGLIKGVGIATSAFILLPAGRDVISHETAILPGEAETRPLLTATEPKARNFMWGVWGLNHCALSWLKVQAIKNDDKPMLKFLFATAAVTLGYLVKEKAPIEEAGGDVMGFVAICALQSASLGYLAYK